jgi:soluble lytic murein transglycosylase-like protein
MQGRLAVRSFSIAAIALALASPSMASPELGALRMSSEADFEPQKTVCELIDEASARHELPVEFFTRLIWQESTFRPHVVSPKGAQGIAQFMPATASRRGLTDPFDPAAAIPAAAGYLNDLAEEFGIRQQRYRRLPAI